MSPDPSNRRSAAPPSGRSIIAIWVFAVVLGLGGLSLAFLAVNRTEVGLSETFVEHNRSRLDEVAAAGKPDVPVVVLLGSSRLRFATESDERLSAEVSDALGTEATIVRVVNNRATFADFAPLAEAIVAADPAMVVFEERLLVRNPTGYQDVGTRREYLLWDAVGGGPWDPGQLDQVALQEENECFDGTKEAEEERLIQRRQEKWDRWLDFDPEGSSAIALRGFIEELDETGIEARLLRFPDTSAAAELLGRYRVESDPISVAPVLSPDFIVPDEHYCDLIHLDQPGRDRYSSWLVDTLAGELLSLGV